MSELKIIENKEKNVKLELSAGTIALFASLIFVFSNRIGNFYQIYYVIFLFAVHQINQAIIFNRWNFNTEFKAKKLWLRILIIILVLIVFFLDLGRMDTNYANYFGFTSEKRSNTFLSIVIYCCVYFIIYFLRLKRINKK